MEKENPPSQIVYYQVYIIFSNATQSNFYSLHNGNKQLTRIWRITHLLSTCSPERVEIARQKIASRKLRDEKHKKEHFSTFVHSELLSLSIWSHAFSYLKNMLKPWRNLCWQEKCYGYSFTVTCFAYSKSWNASNCKAQNKVKLQKNITNANLLCTWFG